MVVAAWSRYITTPVWQAPVRSYPQRRYPLPVPDLEIRPNTVSQTIDAVFKIYLERFAPLIAIVAVVTVPILLLQGVVNLSLVERIEATDPASIQSFSDLAELFAPSDVATSLTIGLLSWLAGALASGAVIVVVADAYLGRTTTWQDALRRALHHLVPLLIGSLLFGLGVAAGILAFLIPGIVLAVGWGVFGPAVVVEDLGGARALGRSWQLTRGRRWPVLGAYLVMLIIGGIISTIIGTAFGGGEEYTMIDVIVGTLAGVLTGPLTAVTAGVLYIELRSRQEAFDRLLLSSELSRPEPPSSMFR